jgi:hypothetical protein
LLAKHSRYAALILLAEDLDRLSFAKVVARYAQYGFTDVFAKLNTDSSLVLLCS